VINMLQLATRKDSNDTIVTVIINLLTIKICYYHMFTLEQKIFIVQFRNSYNKDNVTFYLPLPLHFLSYQSNRLLRRSDLHRNKFLTFELS
jgi:hypothetical protein